MRISSLALWALALATATALWLVAPQPCGACPPAFHEVEILTLALESVEVDGNAVPVAPDYDGVAVTLEAAASVPLEVWLVAQVSPDPSRYFGRFR